MNEAGDDRWAQIMEHMPAVGDSFRLFYNAGNMHNRVIHVRAIVDDEYIVLRYWSKRRGYWIYQLEDVIFFHVNREHLTKIKSKSNG